MNVEAALQGAGYTITDFEQIAVTGGRYRDLPGHVNGIPLVKVPEVHAIGRGGLLLSQRGQALVVSAGSGTAMVAAEPGGSHHVTGSAVGGGTLLGLGQLLLGTNDAEKIDQYAAGGDANRVDLTLEDAIGGTVGSLPADANAVNFGKLADMSTTASRADTAAGLVRLIAQVIAVIAINAASAAGMKDIVFIGTWSTCPGSG